MDSPNAAFASIGGNIIGGPVGGLVGTVLGGVPGVAAYNGAKIAVDSADSKKFKSYGIIGYAANIDQKSSREQFDTWTVDAINGLVGSKIEVFDHSLNRDL